ncbi:MAB_1171c family putative transporter [Streptomyces sp. NPDC056529]|uniref:MAB_1171c family putative transporter n=1 Tax=Streptomyces sp. NPDC056529 TaxID=3345855 RepID=UPI0036AC4CC2
MSLQQGVNLYVPAAALGLVLIAKFPSLVRRWHTPVVRSVNAVIFFQAAAFFFSAPPTIVFVNRATGVGNFSALVVYCLLSGYACACRVLMENWREDARVQPRTRRRVRRWIWGHVVVTVLLVGCFALGEAPVERQRDFETYYATTPFIREMVLLCLLACTAATGAAAVACLSWAYDIRRRCPERGTSAGGSLRIGLAVLAVGFLTHLTYAVVKLVSVVGVWFGRDWEAANQTAVTFAGLATVLVAAGFLIPIGVPWLAERLFAPLYMLRALRPLWRAVCADEGDGGRMRLVTPWYAGPGRRLTDRMTDIHDRMLELGPYCSEEERVRAEGRARRAGRSRRESAAIGLAVMFRAAAEERARGVRADAAHGAAAVRALRAAEADRDDLLVGIARALGDAAAAPAR